MQNIKARKEHRNDLGIKASILHYLSDQDKVIFSKITLFSKTSHTDAKEKVDFLISHDLVQTSEETNFKKPTKYFFSATEKGKAAANKYEEIVKLFKGSIIFDKDFKINIGFYSRLLLACKEPVIKLDLSKKLGANHYSISQGLDFLLEKGLVEKTMKDDQIKYQTTKKGACIPQKYDELMALYSSQQSQTQLDLLSSVLPRKD